jgi:hypothetical protein
MGDLMAIQQAEIDIDEVADAMNEITTILRTRSGGPHSKDFSVKYGIQMIAVAVIFKKYLERYKTDETISIIKAVDTVMATVSGIRMQEE